MYAHPFVDEKCIWVRVLENLRCKMQRKWLNVLRLCRFEVFLFDVICIVMFWGAAKECIVKDAKKGLYINFLFVN